MQLYYSRHGGAVLACLEASDRAYERQLDRAGIEFETLSVKKEDAPAAEVLQKCAVRPDRQTGKLQVEVGI